MTKAQLDKIIKLIPGYDPVKGTKKAGMTFDYEEANQALEFFPEFVTHVKGELAGQPFHLEDWEKAIVANIFGWKRKDKTRRYREALIFVPRKNGKSPLGAGIALCVFILDSEPGMEIYSAAAEAEQAGLIFNMAAGMVRNSPEMSGMVDVWKRSMTLKDDPMSAYKYISAGASSKHGYNTHCGLIDELHVCDRDLIEVLDTSTAARRQPLLLYFTTSDYVRESICNEKYDYACRVRDGDVDDLAFLPVIYELSKKDLDKDPDCWRKPKYWAKANPNLGVSKKLEDLERQCQKAVDNPAFENEFKRLHLNIRTETEERWIPGHVWSKNDGELDLTKYEGQLVAGAGLDLGNTSDITSLCLAFDDGDDGLDYFWWNWMPRLPAEEQERKHDIPYSAWSRHGHVTLTPGNETYYQQIRADIVEIGQRFGLANFAADRLFQGAQLVQELQQYDGFEMTAFGQGWVSMTAPMTYLMDLLQMGKAKHGNNPVARWASANITASLKEGKNADSEIAMAPGKPKGYMKIDPIVAMIMATGMAQTRERHTGSVYDTRGMLKLR